MSVNQPMKSRSFRAPVLCATLCAVLGSLLAVTGCGGDPAPEALTVSVGPVTVTLAPGGTQLFYSAVAGTQRTAVTWSVEPAGCGQITNAGLYTAPATEGACTVRATAQVDPTKSATAQVTVVRPTPVIASFTANPTSTSAGGSSTLSWSVTGADSLSIDQGVGAVTGTSTVVSPTSTTLYTLTATNASGPVTKQAIVTVVVPGAPVITAFTAAPASITAGQSSTLSWTVTGATSLSIDQGVGGVTGTTGKSVTPAATTTYTLTAANGNGTVTAQTTVAVGSGGPPAITSFTATPPQITKGASVTLSWVTSSGAALSIDQGVGAVSGTSTVVTPTGSTTYLLSATSGGATVTLPVTVTVNPAAPAAVIHDFSIDGFGVDASATTPGHFGSVTIKSGDSATLRWAVANATNGQVAITGLGTQPAVNSKVVTPSVTTTYTLTAAGGGKSPTAQVTVAVVSKDLFLTPGSLSATPDVTLTVDSGLTVHPISPFIYGYNASTPASAPSGATLLRLGGNRWTAWNWETGASNAGSDYIFESDDFLTSSTVPGAAIKPTLDACQSTGTKGCAALVTIPMQGWVAADENKSVPVNPADPPAKRFFPIAPRKGTALVNSPDTTDKLVYADELAHWVDTNYPLSRTDAQRPIHFSLDNEPDLWCGGGNATAACDGTHREIQQIKLTYADLISKTINLSAALKDTVPTSLIYGPVSYGWNGYQNLQSAPDSTSKGDFLDAFLSSLKSASDAQGRRLLDVLDLHFYSEAKGNGVRITEANNTAAVVAARVQAPRSLWEAGYKENSWITDCCASGGTINLLPRMAAKIAAANPGTKLALTEYNHGGGDHISGAVAEADALGIFGRTGLYAATYWPLLSNDAYTFGAFRLYRNYDGSGATFGDTSVSATSSDLSKVAVHASMNAGHPEKLFVLVINRDTVARSVALVLKHTQQLSTYTAWQLAEPVQVTSGSAIPKQATSAGFVGPGINATLLTLCQSPVTGCGSNNALVPPMSATLVVLQ